MVTTGVGLTVTLKDTGKPVHPLYLGTMVTEAEPATGKNGRIEATSVASGIPIAVPPLISNNTPDGVPLNAKVSERMSLQKVKPMGAMATGCGLTVMVNIFGGPSQVTPPVVRCGVTSMVATIGSVPELMAVKGAIIFPVPLAAKPIEGSLLVQVYVVVPLTLVVVKVIMAVEVPVHTSWSPGWFTCASGRTSILKISVAVCGAQVLSLVTVNVSVTVVSESPDPAV